MKFFDFVLILTGVLLNAGAQLLLKAGAMSVGPISLVSSGAALWRTGLSLAQHPSILGGLALYAISVAVWIVALSRVDVSIAYPMLSIGYVVSALVAWGLFHEAVTAQRWIGMGVILIGVTLVARSGSAA
ncbi:SMR family transporter [Variovorax sp. RT4R15]|uniref:SMR family transporter n=1 Tax=Variovorax sp. RT4R15 TaxID=3443737 RepID=UPI003F461891